MVGNPVNASPEAARLGGDDLMIFFRTEGFYPVQGIPGQDLRQQAQEHAELNPGTLRIEDINGAVLWSLQ